MESDEAALIRLRQLERAVIEMHEADDAYGCGFYGEESWTAPYDRTRELVGMAPQ